MCCAGARSRYSTVLCAAGQTEVAVFVTTTRRPGTRGLVSTPQHPAPSGREADLVCRQLNRSDVEPTLGWLSA